MAHYAIGDLQGCFAELTSLLQTIDFNHGIDTLWLVGDIVNRGSQSLECLQFCMQHESSVQMVLGNHDLHLLALMFGSGSLKKGDTLSAILQHKHVHKMRNWLRQQPLMRHNDTHVLVHAGLLPQWSVALAQDLADEVAQKLVSKHAAHFFEKMYGNKPDAWQPELSGLERLRLITNVFTRMRVLHADGSLNYHYKEDYAHINPNDRAWFDAPNRQHLSHTIVFGHWSALGFMNDKKVIALDTGALWGGELTAFDLNTQEKWTQPSFQQKTIFQAT